MIRAILIHGNGGSSPTGNWFPYLKSELEKLGIAVEAPQFPDAELARASYWIPYLKDVLKADENTIIIGHSSGAVAAMRFAEENRILGSVLVGTCYTDLGVENEKLSGYYDHPWNWSAIKKNQQWIIQFAGTNDPWIPIEEARHIKEKLETNYYESDQGHFGGDREMLVFPEALEAIKSKVFENKSNVNIKQIAEAYAERVWNDKDLKAIDELVDEKCIIHSLLGDFYGAQPMKNVVTTWLKGFPDLTVKNTSVICENDLVAIQWQANGTHKGTFKEIAPTDKPVSYTGLTLYRIDNGKIQEYWAYLDMQHLLQQIS